MQGVQCKNRIKRLAVFGAEEKRCAAMPHWLPQEEFQQSMSIDRGGFRKREYTITLTKITHILKNIGQHPANRHTAWTPRHGEPSNIVVAPSSKRSVDRDGHFCHCGLFSLRMSFYEFNERGQMNSYACEGGLEAKNCCASVPANGTYLLEKYNWWVLGSGQNPYNG